MVDNFGANPAPIFGGLEVLHIFLWSGANILCILKCLDKKRWSGEAKWWRGELPNMPLVL
jgi:hypothetical protein